MRSIFKRPYFVAPFIGTWLVLLLSSPSFSQQPASNEKVDVRLVIDVSGSMKRNDPNNLRKPAVELLVELLPEGGTAGVWTFGKWVNMLIPHKVVDTQWRSLARTEAAKINSVGLFTNIGEALEKAAYDSAHIAKETKKHIILLTDGMVDVDKDPKANRREWRRIVDEVLPRLKKAGYIVHTVALSNNADRDLMNKLSVATDGIADTAESAEELMKIFLKAFDAAVPAEQVPFENNAFVIDSSVEEFTALIFREDPSSETTLVTPDQQRWTSNSNDVDLRWHRTGRYDLVTVKRPLEGSWGVIGKMDPASRITVVSNLNLQVKPLPNNVLKGAELTLSMWLKEDGLTISDPAFIKLMRVEAGLQGGHNHSSLVSLWRSDVQAETANKAHYKADLPPLDKEGVYQISAVVDGVTFQREFKHQITLREEFSADVREQFTEGKLSYILTVNAFQSEVNYSKSQIVATVVTPDNRRLVRALELSELDTWRAEVVPDAEGEYFAEIKVKGVSTSGAAFRYDLDVLKFNYSVGEGLVEAPERFDDPPEKDVSEAPDPEPDVVPTPAPPLEEPELSAEDNTTAISDWVLYIALGLGNLIFMLIGFFAYKKIIGGSKEEVLDELAVEGEEPTEQVVEEPQVEEVDEVDEVDEEEEPPMEDLDPEVAEEVPEPPPSLDEDLYEPDENEADNSMAMGGMDDMLAEPQETLGNDLDGIDDLDAMAMDIAEESAATAEEEQEEDDMVTAMMKAQGLDLAEEELDDAISSLIDDLDDDEDND